MRNFKFPNFEGVYPPESRFLKKVRQRARFYFSVFYCRHEVDVLMDFLNKNPVWLEVFKEKPFRFNTVLHKYCDSRFGKTERLSAMLYTLSHFEKSLGNAFSNRLMREKYIPLLNIDDELFLNINLNDIEPAEGYFAVSLRYQSERVYDASFTLVEPNKLVISSIQGTNSENAQELIKVVTKKLHGVRPMFMLVYLFKMLSEYYGIKLCGIPHKFQAKYRFNDNTRLLFNYDEFWRENGGILKQDYWYLNNQIEMKSLEDIPSKKRSMYRKRYEMLEELSENIKNTLPNYAHQ